MVTLTVKLPEHLRARLQAAAAQRGETRSALVRQAIEELVEKGGKPAPGSCLAKARDLAGSCEGPADLSTNKVHVRSYGR
ncbi:MAG: ribbon-helix-helix protein, CopG family [Candidatus Latescibacterota bacterium]